MRKRTHSWTKAAAIVSKIIQIVYEITAICFLVGAAFILVNPGDLKAEPGKAFSLPVGGLNFSSSTVNLYSVNGTVSIAGVVLYLLYGCLNAAMFALAFRNVHRVLHSSQSESPFRMENVRLLRHSGFLFFGTVIAQFLFGLLGLLVRNMSVGVTVDMSGIVTGILVLCLSQIFAQGVQMQEDIDGLV